jgi:hypothetical protein
MQFEASVVVRSKRASNVRSRLACCAAALAMTTAVAQTSLADEGGVSFWVPGFFGSLSATPLVPGFSFTNIYYHTSVSANGAVAFSRQVSRGNLTANFNGNLNANLNADVDLYFAIPSYTFMQPFLGGQATVLMVVPYGNNRTGVDATLTGNLGLGGPGFTIGGAQTDQVTGFGDLIPQFNVRWNAGMHNFMTYVTGNLTVGRYSQTSLANLGIGHNAIDGGGSYSYFNPQTGREFSATLGFTYNFLNTHTQYQNGVDMHLDLGASQFLTKQLQVGLVGYAYQQLSCDSGSGDRVGCFKSRVFGVGPQIGYIIPLSTTHQAYFNLKGYKEFGAENRPDGWNVWLTLAITPAAPPPPVTKLVTK